MEDGFEMLRNPQSDVVSLSDNDTSILTDITSSEDESHTHTRRVRSSFRTPRSSTFRTPRSSTVRHPSPSPSPVRTMTRHRYLSHIKRCASAPCRVPLQRPFPRRVSLDEGESESESSLPAPYTPGPNDYGLVANPMDEFEGSALEQAKHNALR